MKMFIYICIYASINLDYNISYIDERDFNYKKNIYDFELTSWWIKHFAIFKNPF